MYKCCFKRLLDISCVLVVALFFWWVFLILACLVRKKLGSPVLFSQERPGKDGKIFRLYKFRTMTDARDKNGNLLPDAQRLTRFGKLLRSTSLDELPEFYNVLKGDMSLIGPRPLLVQYLPLYSGRQKHRHDVRPGISGLAQVSGRNAISWEEKFELDVQYVEQCSFLLDIKIIFLTLYKVFKRDCISAEGESTMAVVEGEKK